MIKVGIIGGAGYTAGELIRILLWHPEAELMFVHSNSHHGNPITSVHKDLIGETNLIFSEPEFHAIDVLFLCSGHGKSKQYLEQQHLPLTLKIIDLSQDYRIKSRGHGFVYGLPELNRKKIQSAGSVANPGCFATAIELALLPLAKEEMLKDEVHVNAVTGSTGAGQAPTSTSHFSWKNNNVAVYKPFTHQHLAEIQQSLNQLQGGFHKGINFIPIRGNFSRGIMAMMYTECAWSEEEAIEAFGNYYKFHPFVHVVAEMPDVKQVVNTNKCLLYLEKFGNKLMIISVIDNLLKGASGQAVQNMNLLFGLPEKTGLELKAVGF